MGLGGVDFGTEQRTSSSYFLIYSLGGMLIGADSARAEGGIGDTTARADTGGDTGAEGLSLPPAPAMEPAWALASSWALQTTKGVEAKGRLVQAASWTLDVAASLAI